MRNKVEIATQSSRENEESKKCFQCVKIKWEENSLFSFFRAFPYTRKPRFFFIAIHPLPHSLSLSLSGLLLFG